MGMRGVAAFWRIATGRLALAGLLALLGHLAVMASPAHAAVAHQAAPSAATMSGHGHPAHEPAPGLTALSGPREAANDCAVESAAATPGRSTRALLGPAPLAWSVPAAGPVEAAAPAAQAQSPPLLTHARAFLQVFRM
jgi:hypothetical protein